jgi:glutamine amidotransferase
MDMLAIIDYGAGNIKSVEKAFILLGERPVLSADPEVIVKADKVILPGVGSFGAAMENLNRLGMAEAIHESVKKGTPFMGICLGLQLLFESSEESEGVKGLSVLKGRVVKIPGGNGLKIPHMGWNSLEVSKDSRLLGHLKGEPYVYFVHSYYLQAEDERIVSAVTQYGVKIHAAVESGNVFAAQFHPEKSSDAGLSILDKFLKI